MIDSTPETLKHIRRVQELLAEVSANLIARAIRHDASKLEEPEKSALDENTEALRGLTYGSDEYKAQLVKLKPCLDHHYANNSHHPEFWNNVGEMSLLDIIEMFCDWKAATDRHADGDITKSIEINTKRFGLSEQLAQILVSTRDELDY